MWRSVQQAFRTALPKIAANDLAAGSLEAPEAHLDAPNTLESRSTVPSKTKKDSRDKKEDNVNDFLSMMHVKFIVNVQFSSKRYCLNLLFPSVRAHGQEDGLTGRTRTGSRS